MADMKANEKAFGVEPESYHGELFTKKQADHSQKQLPNGGLWAGKYPSVQGSYMDYYRDVVAAIRGEKQVVVRGEESRTGIKIIEMALESVKKGVTVPWQD